MRLPSEASATRKTRAIEGEEEALPPSAVPTALEVTFFGCKSNRRTNFPEPLALAGVAARRASTTSSSKGYRSEEGVRPTPRTGGASPRSPRDIMGQHPNGAGCVYATLFLGVLTLSVLPLLLTAGHHRP